LPIFDSVKKNMSNSESPAALPRDSEDSADATGAAKSGPPANGDAGP